jgi:hypothetical protein
MARAVSATTAEFFRATHEEWGVEFDFNHGLASIDGKDGRVVGVTTDDGRTLPRRRRRVRHRRHPEHRDRRGRRSRRCSNGIEVDERLVTSDPDISAVGDVVSFPCAQLGGAMTRLESVQNASDQARAVAARLTGDGGDYRTLPWFWSDQGHLSADRRRGARLRPHRRAPGGSRTEDGAVHQGRRAGGGRDRQRTRRPHDRAPPAGRAAGAVARGGRRPRTSTSGRGPTAASPSAPADPIDQTEEHPMQMNCPCGELITGAGEDELVDAARPT